MSRITISILENETLGLLATAQPFAWIRGVVGWVDVTADVYRQLEVLRSAAGGDKIVGTRHVTTIETDESWLARPTVASGLRSLAAAGVPFDVVVRPWQLGLVATLARTLDSTMFVLDHLGKPPLNSTSLVQWTKDFRSLAASEKVVAKISGLVTEDDWKRWSVDRLRPVVDHALEAFGAGRLMFGSDWPLVELAGGYQPWTNVYEELTKELTEAEQASLDSENVRRIYGLQ